MTDFKPGDRVLSILGDRRSGHVVGPAPSSSVRVRFDGQTDTENYHWSNLERIDPMDDSPEPSPHGVAREIIREEILYRLKSHAIYLQTCARSNREPDPSYMDTKAGQAADVLAARLAIFTPAPVTITAELVPDLPEIAYEDIKPGMVVEARRRYIRQEGDRPSFRGDGSPAVYRLVSAPSDPDAELVEQVAKRLHDDSSCEDPYGVCVSSSEHFRSQARDLIALVRQAGGSDE